MAIHAEPSATSWLENRPPADSRQELKRLPAYLSIQHEGVASGAVAYPKKHPYDDAIEHTDCGHYTAPDKPKFKA